MKQPPPSTGLKVTYKPGPVSPYVIGHVCVYVVRAHVSMYVSIAVAFYIILMPRLNHE